MAFKLKPPFMALESEMSLDQTSTPPRNRSRRRAMRRANRGFLKRRRGCGPRGCHAPRGSKSRLAGL